MAGMNDIPDSYADLVLTDIPYGEVNRESNGIRNFDKELADVVTFNVPELTRMLCSKTKGSIYMFCGTEQVSDIRKTMIEQGLSTRVIVWEKNNPAPTNGEYLWLSGIELCVFGRKKNATFNARCRNTVLRYPSGDRNIHPTQKPVNLFRDLVRVSTNEGDIVLDAFMGSGTTAIACIKERRKFIGFELNEEYFRKAEQRIKIEMSRPMIDFD